MTFFSYVVPPSSNAGIEHGFLRSPPSPPEPKKVIFGILLTPQKIVLSLQKIVLGSHRMQNQIDSDLKGSKKEPIQIP